MAQPAVLVLGTLLTILTASPAAVADARPGLERLDRALQHQIQTEPSHARTSTPASRRLVRVIVLATDVAAVETATAALGGKSGRRLTGIGGVVVNIPLSKVERLAAVPGVTRVSLDRRLEATIERTALTIGARWVTDRLGLDGTGVGVAIIDSGVSAGHDDLAGNRIAHFADFVGFQSQPTDMYGHGTHVAGIIAGSGHDSNGARAGIAPGAHLIVLKTLDHEGQGFISNAIAALDYAVEQRSALNIRVINLSVAAGVYESYRTDPLTLAAQRAVDAGIVVVTAAGNEGLNVKGQRQYGGITAPGNAPWVLTVGAASSNGTVDRTDDSVAPFSSRGPSAIDVVAKPDLVAPGVGIESLAVSPSTLFARRPQGRVWGSIPTASEPYLRLSGTSMASPVVAATVALMLQANPALTPAEVKALLQASAEKKSRFEATAQGAGFLDARAAVEMAQRFADSPAPARLDALVRRLESASAEWDRVCRETVNAACEAAADNVVWSNPVQAADAQPGTMGGAAVRADDTIPWNPPTRRTLRRRRGFRRTTQFPAARGSSE
jgi:serine protease AprX